MQKYDLTIMLGVSVKGEAKDKLIERLEKNVKAADGKVVKTTELGQKQLAYPISKQNTANYVTLTLEMPESGVVQLAKKLTVERQKQEILRHLLIKA